jgi:ankyrin repeat protein/tetratricopeptide (TPR) repeat protein
MTPFHLSSLRAFLFFGMILCVLSLSVVQAASGFSEEKILSLLSAGDQNQAEAEVLQALKDGERSPRAIFWAAVLARSRFNLEASLPLFAQLLASQPESLEGRASGFVVGIDTAKDRRTELFYYNALVAQTTLEPNSIPLNWLVGIMTRAIAQEGEQEGITSETRKRILATGVRSYSKVLSLLGVTEGPFCVHQTLANLLDELEAFDQAETHRKITLKKWRTPVSLHSSAWTLYEMFRPFEALSQINEAIALGGDTEKYYHLKGSLLRALDRLPEAIEAWNHAAELSDKSKAYYWDQSSKDFLLLGKPAEAKFYSAKALADYPHAEAYQILDARLAALVGEPDGPQRVANADTFDFNGDVLLKKPDEKKVDTDSPLYAAASTGDLTALRAALPSPDINALSGKYKQTALMAAAQCGFTHIIDELIKHGAALDIVDLNGDTALHYASQFRQLPCLLRLLTAGAKTDIQDKWKQTPLTMVAANKDLRAFRALLPKSRLDQATPHGGTALHYASGYGNIVMIRELIAAGADVNSTARGNGKTPLMSACDEWPHPYIVSPLIKAGTSINLQDGDGKTALAHAVDPLLNRGLVEMLLENGANPTIADKNGVTPIRAARCLGFEDVARLMESVAGAAEPFVFPKFEPPGPDASPEDQRAAAFILPIFLAQGHPLGRVGSQLNEKHAARKELRRMFGIQNKGELLSEIEALEAFRPSNNTPSSLLPKDMTFERLMAIAEKAAEKTFQKGHPKTSDESAWIHSHLIYLSDLGLAAGYLPEEKAAGILKKSTQAIAEKFSNWSAFLDSFLMGAIRYNGWEAERYGNITKLLAANGPKWPNP